MKLTTKIIPIAAATIMFGHVDVARGAGFSTEFSTTPTSQYIWRGFDLNQENAALQGDVTVSHDSGFWFGAWGSNYDVGADDGVEIDLLAGYDFAVSDLVSLGVGITEYTFTGDTSSSTEYYASVSVGQFSLTYFDDVDLDATYLSLDAEFELNDEFSLTLHTGEYDVTGVGKNTDWAIGTSYAASESLSLWATYSDNELDVEGAEDYLVIGASFSF